MVVVCVCCLWFLSVYVSACSYEGAYYRDGQSFSPDNCKQCRCDRGNVTCDPPACPTVDCDDPYLTPGTCCPKCLSGKPFSLFCPGTALSTGFLLLLWPAQTPKLYHVFINLLKYITAHGLLNQLRWALLAEFFLKSWDNLIRLSCRQKTESVISPLFPLRMWIPRGELCRGRHMDAIF